MTRRRFGPKLGPDRGVDGSRGETERDQDEGRRQGPQGDRDPDAAGPCRLGEIAAQLGKPRQPAGHQ